MSVGKSGETCLVSKYKSSILLTDNLYPGDVLKAAGVSILMHKSASCFQWVAAGQIPTAMHMMSDELGMGNWAFHKYQRECVCRGNSQPSMVKLFCRSVPEYYSIQMENLMKNTGFFLYFDGNHYISYVIHTHHAWPIGKCPCNTPLQICWKYSWKW